MKTSRLARLSIIFVGCAFLFFGFNAISTQTARGADQPDYSWVLKTSLKKHLSGAMLSYLKRAYGPKKLEKDAHNSLASTRPANEIAQGKTLVNDPATDFADNSTQSETSLAVYGEKIVVSWNDAGDFFKTGQFTGYGYSHDGGKTFIDGGPLPGPIGGTSLGDGIVATDKEGNFYISTLAVDKDFFSIIGLVKSTNGGVTFSTPVNVSGTNPRDLPDKEFMAIDTTESPYAGTIYVAWTNFIFFGQFAQITFARSTDGGKTFSAPIPLSAQLANPVQGSSIAIGPEGEVYVTWEDFRAPNSIRMRKSSDGGKTFGPEIILSTFNPIADPDASSNCDEAALNGFIRVNDFPIVAVDRSQGAHHGAIYVTYNADPDEPETDDTSDIFVVRSNDGGQTWSPPTRVNNDQTQNDQFFPFVAVAEDGTVSVIWYDRRIDPDNFKIDLFRAVSTDGGHSFSNERVTAESFGVPPLLPNFNTIVSDCYMGDYNWMAAQGDNFYLAWGDNRNIVKTQEFPEGRPDPDVAFSIESKQTRGAPLLVVGPQRLDFDSVDIGESEERIAFIQNIGGGVLTGSLRTLGEPFALVESEEASDSVQFSLEPGEVFQARIEFSPTSEGTLSGLLRVESNDAEHSLLEIELQGRGVVSAAGPAIRVSPGELNFGEVRSGRTKQVTLLIRNVGTATLTVKKILSNRPSLFRTSGFKGPQTIRPGRQLRVSINGRAAANSRFRAKLTILSNDPEEPKVIVPVELQGIPAFSSSAQNATAPFLLWRGRTLYGHLPEKIYRSAQLRLYDMSGRLAFSHKLKSAQFSLDLSSTETRLARGVYLALIEWQDASRQQALSRRVERLVLLE
jgi:hypothetical protein